MAAPRRTYTTDELIRWHLERAIAHEKKPSDRSYQSRARMHRLTVAVLTEQLERIALLSVKLYHAKVTA